MKKQILFLAFFVLAVLANTITAFGQNLDSAPTCINPTPLEATCVGTVDALHPAAGMSYEYEVTVNEVGAKIHWFVTTEVKVIEYISSVPTLTTDIEAVGGAYIMAAGTEYNISTSATTPNIVNTIDITWKSFDPTTVVLLVTYVENAAGCTDNIQVYRIEPVFNFTLDIAGLNADGTSNSVLSDCVSLVESATYDATANAGAGGIAVDYGENYMYFIVNAANFAHSWMPSFKVVYTGVSTDIEVAWAYPDEAVSGTWKSTTGTAGIYTGATAVLPATAGATGVGAAGECIIVRVYIDHGTDEVLADVTLTLAVDGVMYDQADSDYADLTLGDIHYDAGPDAGTADDCPWTDLYANDKLEYTLTKRPTVTSATPDAPATGVLPFEQKN